MSRLERASLSPQGTRRSADSGSSIGPRMAQRCVGEPCTPTDVVWKGGLVRNLPDRDQYKRQSPVGTPLRYFLAERHPSGRASLDFSRSGVRRQSMKVLMVLMLSLATGAGFAQTSPIRVTTGGYVQGSQQGNVLSFKGIPYAKPPVGDLRWKPPQAPAFSKVLIQATAFGSKCVQPLFDKDGVLQGVDPDSREDCLTLNVWTPAGAARGALPVLFFIHGGNYLNGSASQDLY